LHILAAIERKISVDYGQVFETKEKDRGILVIVDAADGYAFNQFPLKPGQLDRKLTNRKRAELGEMPPIGVLRAYAASGSPGDSIETLP